MYPELDLDAIRPRRPSRPACASRPGELDALRGPPTSAASASDLQSEQVKRLADALPLPQLHLPFLFTTELGPSEVDILSGVLASEIGRLRDPDAGQAPAGAAPAGGRGAPRPAGR